VPTKVDIMTKIQKIGLSIALTEVAVKGCLNSSSTVLDLLALIAKPISTKGPAVRSAASAFLSFLGTSAGETPVHRLESELEGFRAYLHQARYTRNTVKSYIHSIGILLKLAREYSWDNPPEVMPSDWALVLSMENASEVRSIVRYAVRLGVKPSTFSEEHLSTWCQEFVQKGRTLGTAISYASKFRKVISMTEVAHLKPLVKLKPKNYGVSLLQMHPTLRAEVEKLLAYRTDEFELERPGPAIRHVTAERLLGSLVRLTGYVQNIRGGAVVETLSNLLTRDNVVGYVSWAHKERKVQSETFIGALSEIRASFKNHPGYPDLDLSWIAGILAKLPKQAQSEVDGRKERKYISFEAADAIPGKIRDHQRRAKNLCCLDHAIGLRDELMMSWLVILPWRQRNLRECRLTAGTHPNLFLAPVRGQSTATRPNWLVKQEEVDPGKPVWQIRFTKDETKSKNGVTAFLPAELVAKLEQYLVHRQDLIPPGEPDPGKLFLTSEGKKMNSAYLRDRVKELASRYGGKAVNPHLFRDIVAFEWLKNHPEDYLTLSKLLWHRNIEQTLKVYGSRFDESTGIARMDDWRTSRKMKN
jgi:integrase